MNIIRPWLYIGKYRDTQNLSLLETYHIGAMLQLAERVEQPGIISCYLPVEDGQPLPVDMLRRGIDFVLEMHQQRHPVLIACGAGISRSAALTTAVIKEVQDVSLLEALRVVKQQHPDTNVHMALWDSLCKYYDEEIPFLTMLRSLKGRCT